MARGVRYLCGVVGSLALVQAAAAQLVDGKRLTIDGARGVIQGAMAKARSANAPGAVVAVVDDGGNLMALERLDGTFAAGAAISAGKARTAALFKKPTRAFEELINKGRTAMAALADFTPLQGGVPLEVDGVVVGGVGVSGAASAQQNEEIALAGAGVLTTPAGPAGAGVSYFPRADVEAAFAKGAVLFDRADRYAIHASRRDAAGMAEVHVRDADLIYVQEGSATFVVGGTVVDPKTTAPDEIRGREIAGGQARTVGKGDVLVVPAGTPHWFKDVPAALTYYVVKVR